jgi:hypothetical protein
MDFSDNRAADLRNYIAEYDLTRHDEFLRFVRSFRPVLGRHEMLAGAVAAVMPVGILAALADGDTVGAKYGQDRGARASRLECDAVAAFAMPVEIDYLLDRQFQAFLTVWRCVGVHGCLAVFY